MPGTGRVDVFNSYAALQKRVGLQKLQLKPRRAGPTVFGAIDAEEGAYLARTINLLVLGVTAV